MNYTFVFNYACIPSAVFLVYCKKNFLSICFCIIDRVQPNTVFILSSPPHLSKQPTHTFNKIAYKCSSLINFLVSMHMIIFPCFVCHFLWDAFLPRNCLLVVCVLRLKACPVRVCVHWSHYLLHGGCLVTNSNLWPLW